MRGYISSTIGVLNILLFIFIKDISHIGDSGAVGIFPPGFALGVLIVFCIFVLAVIGLILGIISLNDKQKKKLFGIIGVILNAVPLILFLLFIIEYYLKHWRIL